MSGLKVSHKTLSVSEKVELISKFENGAKRADLEKEYGIGQSSVYKIVKKKEEIKAQFLEAGGIVAKKRKRQSEHPLLEECLMKWLKSVMDRNIPVDGPLLKEKSKFFAEQLKIKDFVGSNGWLEGFKKRNNLIFKKVAGESKSVNPSVCDNWQEILPAMLEGYSVDDVYNADETGLFFKCLPDRTFAFKGESCHGGKQSKERITILHCANMSGTDKLPLFVIGKSMKPRCFKGVRTLPTTYRSNRKAWMTQQLFKEWLLQVDKSMKNKKRKILLFLDNCSAHTDIPLLNNVKIVFLPANTTSKLQPLDQGIIQCFKHHYRREVVHHSLTCIEKNVKTEINLLQAMKFARKAWFQVSQSTIKNCFGKAGFKKPEDTDNPENVDDVTQEPAEWSRLFPEQENVVSFEEFVNFDNDLQVAGELTDDDIIASCLPSGSQDTNDEQEPNEEAEEPPKFPSPREALQSLEVVHRFFEGCTDAGENFDVIYMLEKNINKNTVFKQLRMDDFLGDE